MFKNYDIRGKDEPREYQRRREDWWKERKTKRTQRDGEDEGRVREDDERRMCGERKRK